MRDSNPSEAWLPVVSKPLVSTHHGPRPFSHQQMHEYSRCLLSRTNADTLSAEKVAEMHIEKNAGCDSILKKKHAHTYEFVSCHCHHVFTFLHISTIKKTSAPYLVTDVSSSAPCTCRYIIGGGVLCTIDFYTASSSSISSFHLSSGTMADPHHWTDAHFI